MKRSGFLQHPASALLGVLALAACNSILGNVDRSLASGGSEGNTSGGNGASEGGAAGQSNVDLGESGRGDAGAPSSGGAGGAAGDEAVGGTGGGIAVGGAAGLSETGGAPPTVKLPCDIYATDGSPCVAAHSTVRALYAAYGGPLYQVKKGDGTTKDIAALAPGGLADSAAQDMFCGPSACTISIIYDQSGAANHLTKTPPGGSAKPQGDNEADAEALPITIGGHKVYGEHNPAGVGYRNSTAVGTAKGDDAETEYMVTSGDYTNGDCCFEYGNMEANLHDNGEGSAEAVYFGSCNFWGRGGGSGPWVMGDLEKGLWAGNVAVNTANTAVNAKFVTAMLKAGAAGSNHWAIKAGNAQAGKLASMFDGARPNAKYNPMHKEGAIGLGTAGDNSDSGQGNFFEGVMTAHYSSDAADDAVQANIVSVYGQ